ncbi:MAG: hypothetical protein QNJ13_03490 [Paracoccaceae bacterium]|nr:hypothetical protein [Paracoccaceae bacterium]
MISSIGDLALAHWSLPAIDRVNPGATPAIYRPAPDAPDRLEVADPEMIEAIERVRRAVGRSRPKPGRLRGGLVTAVLLGFMAALVLWAPGAIRSQAAALLPEAARATIGTDLLTEIRRLTGAPCGDDRGQQALDRLVARLAPGTTAHVVPSGLETTAVLPGGTLLLGRSVVEDHETPFVVAGYIVEADLRRSLQDPVRAVLDDATLLEASRLLTTGRLADRVLVAHAERLMRSPAVPIAEADLVTRFATLSLPAAPYAYAIDISGETVLGLIEADPIPVSDAAPPIGDSDWVALQGICGE